MDLIGQRSGQDTQMMEVRPFPSSGRFCNPYLVSSILDPIWFGLPLWFELPTRSFSFALRGLRLERCSRDGSRPSCCPIKADIAVATQVRLTFKLVLRFICGSQLESSPRCDGLLPLKFFERGSLLAFSNSLMTNLWLK